MKVFTQISSDHRFFEEILDGLAGTGVEIVMTKKGAFVFLQGIDYNFGDFSDTTTLDYEIPECLSSCVFWMYAQENGSASEMHVTVVCNTFGNKFRDHHIFRLTENSRDAQAHFMSQEPIIEIKVTTKVSNFHCLITIHTMERTNEGGLVVTEVCLFNGSISDLPENLGVYGKAITAAVKKLTDVKVRNSVFSR